MPKNLPTILGERFTLRRTCLLLSPSYCYHNLINNDVISVLGNEIKLVNQSSHFAITVIGLKMAKINYRRPSNVRIMAIGLASTRLCIERSRITLLSELSRHEFCLRICQI